MNRRRIIHVVPRRKITDPETLGRCQRAWESWAWLYEVGGVEAQHYWKYERDAKSIGESRDLPFVKDVFKHGMNRADSKTDIILFSNDDVILHPMILGEIVRHARLYECGSLRRVDIDTRKGLQQMPPLYANPSEFVAISFPHLGRDAFVFTAGWLERHMPLIPDFIIGAWGWDIVLAAMMRLLRGVEVLTTQCMYDCVLGCELPDGLVIHEAHDSKWMAGGAWEKQPANAHNRKLFVEWHTKYCPAMTLERVDKQDFSKAAGIRYARFWEWKGWTIEDMCTHLKHDF